MIQPEGCPAPVALPLAHLRETPADAYGRRIVVGADAGYAVVKYVALVRLADWIQGDLKGDNDKLVNQIEKVLLGASANHWWLAARYLENLEGSGRLAPDTPLWNGKALARATETLNAGRKSRHGGLLVIEDASLASRIDDAVRMVVEAAAPLLDLPLVRRRGETRQPLIGPNVPPAGYGEWTIQVEVNERTLTLDPFLLMLGGEEEDVDSQDIYVYERLTQRGMLVHHDNIQRELRGESQPRGIHQVVTWLNQHRDRRLAEGTAHVNELEPDALAELLRRSATKAMELEWRITSIGRPAERPDVSQALAAMGTRGVQVRFLVGPSGIGKTHELVKWLRLTKRIPLWVRANSWQGDDLGQLLGASANKGGPAVLGREVIRRLAHTGGLAIAIDGVNEARQPDALVAAVCRDLAELDISAHLVISGRPEVLKTIRPSVPQAWLPAGGARGDIELTPLSRAAAQTLWDGVMRNVGLPFDQLHPTTQRLLQIPLLAAISLEISGELLGAEALIGAYVARQTTDLERVLLRQLAAMMFGQSEQILSENSIQGSKGSAGRLLDEAIQGIQPWGEPFAKLLDHGLLRFSADKEITFAHDRILQFFVCRWLVAQVRDTPAERTGPEGVGWGTVLKRVAHSPALAAGVGQAVATLADQPMFAALVTSEEAWERTVGRLSMRALAEERPTVAATWLDETWQEHPRARTVCQELVTIGADIGDVGLLAKGLGNRRTQKYAVAQLPRVLRYAPDIVEKAIRARWESIGKGPFIFHLPSTVTVLHALLVAQVAKGAQERPFPPIGQLTRAVTSAMFRGGRVRGLLRRITVEVLAMATHLVARALPTGPTDHIKEFPRFFRQPPSKREKFRPLVHLFAGEATPQDVESIAREVVCQHEVVPTILLERALIAASRRPATREAALDLAVELGHLAQQVPNPTMGGQSSLYVLSNFLEQDLADGEAQRHRFEQFESLLKGWLSFSEKTGYRWRSSRNKWYKSLFAAAHMQLYGKIHGAFRSNISAELWGKAIGSNEAKNVQLAVDLIDDFKILMLSRGAVSCGMCELEPLLQANWLPPSVEVETRQLLAAAWAEEPDVVGEALALPGGENRRRLATWVQVDRAKNTEGHDLLLDFDDALVLNTKLCQTMSQIFEYMLDVRSFRGFLSLTLRHAVNQVTGQTLFKEAK